MNKDAEHILNDEQLKALMKGIIESYSQSNSNHYEIINYKLDSIETQTTKTNGRLSEVENKVKEIEIDNAKRVLTCPQNKKIEELVNSSMSILAMRKIVIRGITIAGIFFTLLFGLLRLLIEGGGG